MERERKVSSGPDMVVVLGISAIDVLCCALVCSLVLFLMLSQARNTSAAPRGSGRNKDVLLAFNVLAPPGSLTDDWPVIRVRVFEPTLARPNGSRTGESLLFWGDDRAVVLQNVAKPLWSKLVFPDRGQVLWTSDDLTGVDERLSVLQIHNPKPGYSNIEVAYVDTRADLIAPSSATIKVRVSVSGLADSKFTLQLGLDSPACILGADSCQLQDVSGNILESLHILSD